MSFDDALNSGQTNASARKGTGFMETDKGLKQTPGVVHGKAHAIVGD